MTGNDNLPLCSSYRHEQLQLDFKVGNDFYHDRYTDASAGWVLAASILIFFMKAGFLFVEDAFVSEPSERRRVIISKYLDTCASAIAFWLFGFAVSLGLQPAVLGEDRDYILWFFRFTFSSNTATIIGGTLIGEKRKMKLVAVFLYAFLISSVVHPYVSQQLWSDVGVFSPFKFCNGTVDTVNGKLTIQYTSNHSPSSLFVLDFAGSGAVHLLGGMGGLLLTVCLKIEQKLKDHHKVGRQPQEEMQNSTSMTAKSDDNVPVDVGEQPQQPKNFWKWMYHLGPEHIEYAALGVLILWTTWFAFNCGSTESISGGRNDDPHAFKIYHAIAGRIALNMVVCAGSGGLMAIIVAGFVQLITDADSINTNEIANGILSCLVAITGCCAFVTPWVSFAIGLVAVWFYHLGCYIEYKLDLKDTARVVPVHAWSGMLGLLAGAFAEKSYLLEVYENVCSCQELNLSNMEFNIGVSLAHQLLGALFIIAWSIATIGPLFLFLSLIRSSFLAKLLCRQAFPADHWVYKLIGGGALLTTAPSSEVYGAV